MKRYMMLLISCLLLLTACKGTEFDYFSDGVEQTRSNSNAEGENIQIEGNEEVDETESAEKREDSKPTDLITDQPDMTIPASQETLETESRTGQQDGEKQEDGYTAIRKQLDWSQHAISLEMVEELLSHEGMPYEVKRNVSGERVDMTWKDETKLVFLDVTDDAGNRKGTKLMMMDGQLNDSGFQEGYLDQYDVTVEEEYYPQTKERLLDMAELENMNQTDLTIARNEIFARYGRKFEDPLIQALFDRKTWYTPQYEGEEFSGLQESLLNPYEKENLSRIIAYEKKMGYRK